MRNRDDFSSKVKEEMAKRVGYRCSNPFCKVLTMGPQAGPSGTISVGEAAHICAAAPGGKRYKPDMTPEQRKSLDNGIWLCRNHAALIDRDEKYFTVQMLRDWKECAENSARKELLSVPAGISSCKLYMSLFYDDVIECKKWIDVLKMNRGFSIDIINLPIQNDWENRIKEIAGLVGVDISVTLTKILREIEEFKTIMDTNNKHIGLKRMADSQTICFCNRKDIFLERMSILLTDDFINVIGLFSEKSIYETALH